MPGTTATLSFTLYKGFDQGHRDYHMHLGRTTYFRRLVFEADLSDYRASGWGVPRLACTSTSPIQAITRCAASVG